MNDYELPEAIARIVSKANKDNLGDVLSEALEIYLNIEDPLVHEMADDYISNLRFMASGADFGWKLFSTPIMPNSEVSDLEVLQLLGIERALHEMAYGFELVEKSAEEGWGGSSRTRFYLNSLYHYISSLFLIDTSRETHRDLPMGGTVIRALWPLDLYPILEPVKVVLDRPFGAQFGFGEAILMQRHSYLVHGDFSPERIEYLINDTKMRDLPQQLTFRRHMWDLFYSTVLLRLRILSILTKLDINFEEVVARYVQEHGKS